MEDLYGEVDLFSFTVEEKTAIVPDLTVATLDNPVVEPVIESILDRDCLVELKDRVQVMQAVEPSVEDDAYYDEYKGQRGEVVAVKRLLNPTKKRVYTVEVRMDKNGKTAVFYDNELHITLK